MSPSVIRMAPCRGLSSSARNDIERTIPPARAPESQAHSAKLPAERERGEFRRPSAGSQAENRVRPGRWVIDRLSDLWRWTVSPDRRSWVHDQHRSELGLARLRVFPRASGLV